MHIIGRNFWIALKYYIIFLLGTIVLTTFYLGCLDLVIN